MSFKGKADKSNQNVASLLRQQREQQRFCPESVFEKVFEKCLQNIKLINNHGGGVCRFTIPLLLPDAPLYNRRECGDYVVQRLKAIGFDTARLVPPGCVIAEW